LARFRGARHRGASEAPKRQGREREFVGSDITPEFLTGLYESHITSEAAQLSAPYFGKWMRLSGPLGGVVRRSSTEALVRFDRRARGPRVPVRVEMVVRGRQACDQVAGLKPGTEIEVVGLIKAATRSQVVIDQCEVEASTAPADQGGATRGLLRRGGLRSR
jgi:hypothetical protein